MPVFNNLSISVMNVVNPEINDTKGKWTLVQRGGDLSVSGVGGSGNVRLDHPNRLAQTEPESAC